MIISNHRLKWKPRLTRPSLVTAWMLVLVTAISSMIFFNRGKGGVDVVNMDGHGYYAYLPYFIESGASSYEAYLNYSYQNDSVPDFLKGPPGYRVNKYFVGEAVLLIPFYLMGHVCASCLGMDTTGYVKPYFFFVAFAAYFYFALSVFALRKVLLMLGFSEYVTAFVLAAGVMCTNLIWYAAMEPSMSHVYSFFLFNSFLYLLLKLKSQWRFCSAILLCLILGLIVLVRPTNLLILIFIPYFIDLVLIKRLFLFFYGWLVFGAICFIQLLVYKLQCGSWIVWSYSGEYFDFFHPHLGDTWFSWTKGLIIFFPVFILSFVGLILMVIKSVKKAGLLFVPLLIVFYALSCWHAWHYGWSFGMRGFIEYYAFLFIPLAYFVEWSFDNMKRKVLLIIFVGYTLCHTLSATQMAIVDYGFIQEMTGDKWQALLFKSPGEMKRIMEKFPDN